MLRRSISALMLVALTLLVLAAPALAGGWAAVTLDRLPADVRAGETLHLGFMVRQHGKTPINNVTPYLRATRPGASEILRVDAKQEGPVGHFVLDVTFPSAGTWDWQIVPEPFEGTAFAPLTVLPAAVPAQAAPSASQPPASAEPQPGAAGIFGLDRSALRWGGLALLLVAAGLALATQRVAASRRALRAR